MKWATVLLGLGVCLPAVSAAVTRPSGKTAATEAKPAGASLRGLSLADRVAQLMIVRGYGDYPTTFQPDYMRLRHWIKDLHIGGMIVAGHIRDGNVISAQPYELAAYLNHLQKLSRVPLLIGADFEHGASQRVAETARFPYLMAYGAGGDLDAVRALGAATAREARALGVHWVFAPDADVNNNPDNPIINIRSYSESPQAVSDAVGAFIDGAHADPRNRVLVTAKHFPGHGDTSQDSHLQLARLDQDRRRMETVELMPFRAAIAHHVDAIMTAHLAVPAYEPEPLPATVSPTVLSGLLRDQLGFQGVVVTDALDMQGVASLFTPGEAAVRALLAGADVLLMPPDPDAALRAVLAAVKSGRISKQRIDRSAARVVAAKRALGLYQTRTVDLDRVSDVIRDTRFEQSAQRVADSAVTLVRDTAHLFPLEDPAMACVIVLAEHRFSSQGQALLALLFQRAPKLRTYVADGTTSEVQFTALGTELASCQQVYVAAFSTVAAGRGSVALSNPMTILVNDLVHGTAKVALIALGNPYLLRDFPDVAAYVATFSPTRTSELAAAKAILGEIPITGKLPVSIPPVAKLGDGLAVPVRGRPASNSSQ